MARQYWLFKTEPSDYSYDDLVRDTSTVWDGVSNALALKHLRQVKRGDRVLVYHTGTVRSAVGIAEVTKGSYVDPTNDDPKLAVVDIRPVRKLTRPVSLDTIKSSGLFGEFDLVRLPRLSIVPMTEDHWKSVLELSKD